jgi:hypothetical protein
MEVAMDVSGESLDKMDTTDSGATKTLELGNEGMEDRYGDRRLQPRKRTQCDGGFPAE